MLKTFALVICLLVVVSSLDVSAQSASTGALTGTVTDPTGAVVQNAQIVLRNREPTRRAPQRPIGTGHIVFPCCRRAIYELTVEAVGFAPVVVREVLIRITEVRSIATQLAVQGVREEVVVQAPLPTNRQRRARTE